MKHKLILLYSWIVYTLSYFLPDFPILMRFRGWLYGLGMRKCGRNFQVCHSVIINGLDDLSVGNNVYFANFCHIISNGTITIEDDVLFGPGIIISSGNHQYDGNGYNTLPSDKKDVIIKSGAWIAANVTITGGSIVPKQSVIAAHACVTPKMQQDSHCLYAGVPAVLVKQL